MNKKLKIVFVVIWIIALMFFAANVISRFAEQWMISSFKFIYVSALICLFINPNFLGEKTTNSEKLVELKGNDIWGLLLIILGITGLLLFIGFKSSVILVMATFTFFISIWILIKYRIIVTKSLIINGLILGFLCSIALYRYIPSLIIVFFLIPSFFVSASILNERFQITTIHINKHSFSKIIKSFLIGCIFALPMAISNLSDTLSTDHLRWLNQFWQPILALNMVVLEETWVRLFIITFIYALVSSKTNKRIIPIFTAILISSIIFGSTHYPQIDIQNCFQIMVFYGLPLGVLFYKRDFETVIGYHFMNNFLAAFVTYLITKGFV